MRSTIKYAKARLVRFEAARVYSYEISWNARVKRRAGVYGKTP